MADAQDGTMGRAPVPLSPPTITHSMSAKLLKVIESRSGSTERK